MHVCLAQSHNWQYFCPISGSGLKRLLNLSYHVEKHVGPLTVKMIKQKITFQVQPKTPQTNACLRLRFGKPAGPKNILDQLIRGVGVALWRHTLIRYSTSAGVCASGLDICLCVCEWVSPSEYVCVRMSAYVYICGCRCVCFNVKLLWCFLFGLTLNPLG